MFVGVHERPGHPREVFRCYYYYRINSVLMHYRSCNTDDLYILHTFILCISVCKVRRAGYNKNSFAQRTDQLIIFFKYQTYNKIN